MEYDAIDSLRERHPAWRLLRAGNAVLVLSFLGEFFVEGEPYVKAIGFVDNPAGTFSRLQTMTIEEYRTQRRER